MVIVGAGYGGLSTALELRRNGIDCVVLERGVFGIGASTRNGGMLSGGTNIAKGLGGKNPKVEAEFERQQGGVPRQRRRLAADPDRHHRAREDRLRADHQRPLHRRLDAQAL